METVQEIDNETQYKMGELISQIHSTLVILQAFTEDKSGFDKDIENINNLICITAKNSCKLRKMIYSFKTKSVQ